MTNASLAALDSRHRARSRKNPARRVASLDMILVLSAWLLSWGGVFLAIKALHSVF